MRLVTSNIKSRPQMAQSKVVSDLQAVRELGGIICWQEISRQRYKDALRSELADGWEHMHTQLEVPISFESHWWEAIDAGYVRTHEGRPLVSPERFLSWVLLKHPGTGSAFAVINTHYCSGAWNHKPMLFKQWRKAKWLEHWQAHRNLVLSFYARGITVIGGGDFNRMETLSFHKDMRWFTGHAIDKLYLLEAPAGVHFTDSEVTVTRDLNTDHPARSVTLVRTGK